MDDIRKDTGENEEPEVEGHVMDADNVANYASNPEDVAMEPQRGEDPGVANDVAN